MKKIFECEAKIENLPSVIAFVEKELESVDCGMKQQMQIAIAVEEVYVNISHYAYAELDGSGVPIPDTGTGPVNLELDVYDGMTYLTFVDEGIPYNPLEKRDPDVTLSADEREIGGLGIFMVKKSMDDVVYEHKDGKNILTLVKSIQ